MDVNDKMNTAPYTYIRTYLAGKNFYFENGLTFRESSYVAAQSTLHFLKSCLLRAFQSFKIWISHYVCIYIRTYALTNRKIHKIFCIYMYKIGSIGVSAIVPVALARNLSLLTYPA